MSADDITVDVECGQCVYVATCGMLDGDKFLIRFRLLFSCGSSCDMDFVPDANGRRYIGEASGIPNIMKLDIPGRYVFVFEGIKPDYATVRRVGVCDCGC